MIVRGRFYDYSRLMAQTNSSEVWKHFVKVIGEVEGGKQQQFTKCLICQEKLRYFGGTTNMINHLKIRNLTVKH